MLPTKQTELKIITENYCGSLLRADISLSSMTGSMQLIQVFGMDLGKKRVRRSTNFPFLMPFPPLIEEIKSRLVCRKARHHVEGKSGV